MGERQEVIAHAPKRIEFDFRVNIATVGSVIVAAIGLLIAVVTWKGDIGHLLADHERRIVKVEEDVLELYQRLSTLQTDVAVIRTLVGAQADALRRIEAQLDSIIRASQQVPK